MDISRESIETYVYNVELTADDWSNIRMALSSASTDNRFVATYKANCKALYDQMTGAMA